jgi:hypothetical protein
MGIQTQVQSSCVHGESTNLCEQHVDQVSQSYGFTSLISHSVFLADGTERSSYYALPENYALERVVYDPVFPVYDDEVEGCFGCSLAILSTHIKSNKKVDSFSWVTIECLSELHLWCP